MFPFTRVPILGTYFDSLPHPFDSIFPRKGASRVAIHSGPPGRGDHRAQLLMQGLALRLKWAE